jgi:hypothetical protein
MELGTYEERLQDDDLEAKKKMIQELLQTKLKDVMKEYQENLKREKKKRSQSQQVQRKSKGNLELEKEVNLLEDKEEKKLHS